MASPPTFGTFRRWTPIVQHGEAIGGIDRRLRELARRKAENVRRGCDPDESLVVLGDADDGVPARAGPVIQTDESSALEPGQAAVRPDPERAIPVLQERTDRSRSHTVVVRVGARLPILERQQASAHEANPYAVMTVRVRQYGRSTSHRRHAVIVGEDARFQSIQSRGIAQPQPPVGVAGHGRDPVQRHAVREGNLREPSIFEAGQSGEGRRPHGAAFVAVHGAHGIYRKAVSTAIQPALPIGQEIQSV